MTRKKLSMWETVAVKDQKWKIEMEKAAFKWK